MKHSGIGASSTSHDAKAYVGVDVGGTHTDVCVAFGGSVVRGKALTTYDDFSKGVIEAVEIAARELDLTLDALLDQTELFVNSTTVVTNTITQLNGSAVGVLVTSGFKDAFRFAGGPRKPVFDDHLQTNVPDLFDRRWLAEIDGRIDYLGRELVRLGVDQVKQHVVRLIERDKVDTLAVCFLNSYQNPAHELQAEELIHSLYPQIFVSLSHRMGRLQGENRRWPTAVLNSYVQPRLRCSSKA